MSSKSSKLITAVMSMSRNQYCKLARDCIETPLKSDIGVLSICDCKPTRASCFTPIFTHTACSTTFLPEVAHGRNKSNSPCSGWMDPGETQALELQTLYSEGCRKIIIAVPCRYHTCRNMSFAEFSNSLPEGLVANRPISVRVR